MPLPRRWLLALLVSLPLVGHQALAWRPRSPPLPCGPSLRVLSANLLMVNPDPAPLAQEILASDADLLLLQELSPRWVDALDAAGVTARWPYGPALAREDSFGTAILSRSAPLDSGFFELDGLPQARAVLDLGGARLEVWNVHTLPPRTVAYARAHAEEMDLLLEGAKSQPGPFLMGGDFNAHGWSPFVRRMRAVMDDAWELAGRGPGATWPNGVFFLPPLRLDHLYLSTELTVTHIEIGQGEHSDHRPLLADLAARAGGPLCR